MLVVEVENDPLDLVTSWLSVCEALEVPDPVNVSSSERVIVLVVVLEGNGRA